MTDPRDGMSEETTADHVVQFFDADDSRADAVAAFVRTGLERNDTVLVLASNERWRLVADRLRSRRIDIAMAVSSGQLTVLDAAAALGRLMRHGRPDAELFAETVGALVRRMGSGRGRLRIYGEMVDLLAAEGNFGAAQGLEALWNQLGRRQPFELLCAYSADHFGDPRAADALRLICGSHSHVRSNPRDVLGNFLVRATCSAN